jgi:hypothetical protein
MTDKYTQATMRSNRTFDLVAQQCAGDTAGSFNDLKAAENISLRIFMWTI